MTVMVTVAVGDAAFGRALAEARAAWPAVDLPADTFAAWIAERLDPALDPVAAIASLHAADLYLACACAHGDRRALDLLDRHFFGEVRVALAATGADASSIEEATQRLRTRLLVADGSDPPRIALYTGRGKLRAFLGVAGARELLQMRRAGKRERPAVSQELGALVAPGDPEIEYLKRYYRQELSESFAEAAATLTPRQRNLLRYAFVDGMTHAEIATIYRLPKTTLRHQLDKARETMLRATHRAMRRRLQVGKSELESILRLIASQVHLSLGSGGDESLR